MRLVLVAKKAKIERKKDRNSETDKSRLCRDQPSRATRAKVVTAGGMGWGPGRQTCRVSSKSVRVEELISRLT